MFQMCRTCLHKIQDSNFFTLTNNSTVAIIIKNQLALCIPEIIPDMVSDPVMCHSCVTALHSAFDFKYQCLQSEERIRNFVESNTIHNSPTGVNLMEMFPNITGEVCANAFAHNMGNARDTQLVNNLETLLDIKYEPLPIDEVEEDLVKIDTGTFGNVLMEGICAENVDFPPSNQEHNMSSRIPEEMCTLEKLCDSEELQLHFNCMFIEQSRYAKKAPVDNEFSMVPMIPRDNSTYNLEAWSRFEETHLGLVYSEETTYMESEEEEENFEYSNVSSSYNTDELHLRGNEKISVVNEENEEKDASNSLVRRPKLIRAAKRKIEMQTNPYNPEFILKCKKVSYKRRKFVQRSKLNAIKNLFKCSECEYTTNLQINLELHSIIHININNASECQTNAASNVGQCSTIYHENKISKGDEGYEYLRYDYPKKKTFKSDKHNYIKRKKRFNKNRSKNKSFRNDQNHTKTLVGKEQFFISDYMEDQCLSELNENNQFVESDHNPSITNDQNKDKSLTSNHIGMNDCILSKSREDQIVTDDHTQDNQKNHAEEEDRVANNYMEENEITEGSHNIVEENHVEEESCKSDKDNTGDQFLSDHNESDKIVRSQFITNNQNEDKSHTSNRIGNSRSIVSESVEDKIITNDHTQDNEKDHVEEEERVANDYMKQNEITKDSHNIVEENHMQEESCKSDNDKDNMGDQFLSDHNESDKIVRSEHDPFITNYQNEDKSLTSNRIGNSQSIVSESVEDKIITNDHTQDNEKDHVEEEERVANDYMEQNEITKDSHNVVEEIHVQEEICKSDNDKDNMGVQFLSDRNENGQFVKSDRDQSIAKNQNEGKSLTGDQIRHNQFIISVSKKVNTVTNDHTDDNKKDRVEEEEWNCTAQKEIIEGSCNIVEKNNSYLEEEIFKSDNGKDNNQDQSLSDHNEENNQFLESDHDESIAIDQSMDKSPASDYIGNNQSILSESGHDKVVTKADKNDHVEGKECLTNDYTEKNEILEGSHNSVVEEEIFKSDNDKEGQFVNNSCNDSSEKNQYFKNSDSELHQFSKNSTILIDSPPSLDLAAWDQYNKSNNEEDDCKSNTDTGESQPFKTDHTKELQFLNCGQIIENSDHIHTDKSFKNSNIEENKFLEDSPVEDNVTTKCIKQKDNEYVVNLQSKSNILFENNPSFKTHDTKEKLYENAHINGHKLLFNNDIDSVEAEIKTNQNEGNIFNTNEQSLRSDCIEQVQPFENDNAKHKFNSVHNEEKQSLNSEENHLFKSCFLKENVYSRNDSTGGNKLHIDYIEANQSFSKNDNVSQSENHSNGYGYAEESNNEYCDKTEYVNNTSVEDNKFGKDDKSAFENQFLMINKHFLGNDHTKQNEPFKSDNIEGKKFFKRFNYTEIQSFKNTEKNSLQNDYGKKFFNGTHIGEFFKNTQIRKKKIFVSECGGKAAPQSGQCAEKLSDVPTKRKLKNDHVKKKFFKSECSSEKLSASGCMENTISKCSDSDHFEFGDCNEDEFAATLIRNVQNKVKFVLGKRHSTKEKVDTKLLPKGP